MLVVPVPSSTVTAGNGEKTALTTSVNAKNATGTGTTSMTINQALTSAPLFFVRSGYVGNYYNGSSWTTDYSKLEYPGSNAYYWSRSSYCCWRGWRKKNGNVYPSAKGSF